MDPYRIAVLSLADYDSRECHSYHYAPFMDACQPLVLRELYPGIHFWFTDGNHPNEFNRIEPVDGFKIVKTWDSRDRKWAEEFATLLVDPPEVCDTLAETMDGIDGVFIADGGGDGGMHRQHVAPFLERGIPTFIDKPFARQYADAKAMVDKAVQTGTPLMSASILGHVEQIDHFKSRWREIAPPGLAVVKGVGPSLGAIIHGLALAQGVFGTGVDWVEVMGTAPDDSYDLSDATRPPGVPGNMPLEVMMLHYPDERIAIVLNTIYQMMDWFSCEVWSRTQRTNPPGPMYLRSPEIGDPEYLAGTTRIVKLFKRMLETKQPPIPYESMLELIAIVEAGRRAGRTRKRTYLAEVTGTSR